jgi:cephalosporin hydroxylase
MNEIKKFIEERENRISDYEKQVKFQDLSNKWCQEAILQKYVYNFEWLGRPIIQFPQDILSFQEIVWKTKPDLIIETGIAHGGSIILSASILQLLDFEDARNNGDSIDPNNPKRKVLGIDIDIRGHNKDAILSHPLSSYIEMRQDSSVSEDTAEFIQEYVKKYKRVMVCLDSMHTEEHVLKELNIYAPLVSQDCYCVVFDTVIDVLPVNLYSDRPWEVGDNPMSAVKKWIPNHPEFIIDTHIDKKNQLSSAPLGYLKRV